MKRQVWTLATILQAFPNLDEERFATDLDTALTLPSQGPAVAVLHYKELRRLEEIQRLATPGEEGTQGNRI